MGAYVPLTPEYFEARSIPVTETGCWLWDGCTKPNGYAVLKRDGKERLAHRASWRASNGPIPDGFVICHSCDVRSCVNPAHLRADTQTANMQDMHRRGRAADRRGGKAAGAKLTDDQVREIRAAVGVSQSALSKQYGVDQGAISRIRAGKSWQNLL